MKRYEFERIKNIKEAQKIILQVKKNLSVDDVLKAFEILEKFKYAKWRS